jgi:hypothetical protein
MKSLILLFIAFLISSLVLAQDSLMHTNVEAQGIYTTNDQVPFWLRSIKLEVFRCRELRPVLSDVSEGIIAQIEENLLTGEPGLKAVVISGAKQMETSLKLMENCWSAF